MHHRRTRPLRLQQIRFQPEIPLRRPVGIINQHQTRIVFQSLGLQNHRLLVLPQKFLRKYSKNPNRQQQIPSRNKINPAKIAPHRRHCRAARKPQLPAPNLFRPDIRQNKINRRRHRLARIFLQHSVRRAVRARRVRAHPKTIRNRLELFFLLVNAMPTPPVPRLMHKRPVRRIHQSNNPLVHMRRQLASQMRNPIFLAERRQFRRGQGTICSGGARPSLSTLRLSTLGILRESLRSLRLCVIFFFSPTLSRTRWLSRDARTRIHVHPKISIPLFASIMPRKNALHLQFVLASQRRNLNALPAACLKFPPVITALQILPVESPVRKRNAPMRARIAHRKRFALSRAPQDKRHFQKHCRLQMVAGNFRAPQRRIPEIPQKSSIVFGNSLSRRFAVRPQQTSHRFAHSFFPLLPWVNPSSQFNVPQHNRRVHLPKGTACVNGIVVYRFASRQRLRASNCVILISAVFLEKSKSMYAAFY